MVPAQPGVGEVGGGVELRGCDIGHGTTSCGGMRGVSPDRPSAQAVENRRWFTQMDRGALERGIAECLGTQMIPSSVKRGMGRPVKGEAASNVVHTTQFV